MNNEKQNPKPLVIHDLKLITPLKDAIRSEGYLIMISIKNGDKLDHTFVRRNYPMDDFTSSLDQHAKMLKQEIRKHIDL